VAPKAILSHFFKISQNLNVKSRACCQKKIFPPKNKQNFNDKLKNTGMFDATRDGA